MMLQDHFTVVPHSVFSGVVTDQRSDTTRDITRDGFAYVPVIEANYQINLSACQDLLKHGGDTPPETTKPALLKAGDIIGSVSPNRRWLYVSEDLPNYLPRPNSWVFRRVNEASMPPLLLLLYRQTFGAAWTCPMSNKLQLRRVLGQHVTPWRAVDVEKLPRLLALVDELQSLQAQSARKLDELSRAIAQRLVRGMPLSAPKEETAKASL